MEYGHSIVGLLDEDTWERLLEELCSRLAAANKWKRGCPSTSESTLDGLFADPIVRQVMRRDQTDEEGVRRLLKRVAAARTESGR